MFRGKSKLPTKKSLTKVDEPTADEPTAEKSGWSDKWYTPPFVMDFIRQIPNPGHVTQVSLDPYSCEEANREYVQAEQYFDETANGNIQPWGKQKLVWINPPYSDIKIVVPKICYEWSKGDIEHLCVVTKNATETVAIQRLMKASRGPIFPDKRIAFIRGDGSKDNKSPNSGHIIFYFGPNLMHIKDLLAFKQSDEHFGGVVLTLP